MQIWTVPHDGVYRITAAGAQGASGASNASPPRAGGKGARLSGDFNLTSGTQLRILVGQMGLASGGNGGGGGGTFVVLSRPLAQTTFLDILLVAGGGGGTREDVEQDGCDGRATLAGGIGSGGSTTNTCEAW
jgi:hypothetical protein